jgi:uncharacterized protein (TIGR02596 family)
MVKKLSPVSGFQRSGFSLVELLAILGIMSILAAAVLPAMRGPMDSLLLRGATDILNSEFSVARQTSISRNLPVEVRIYKAGPDNAWRIVALVIPSAASAQGSDEWLDKPKLIPGNIVMDSGLSYSTVLSEAATPVSPTKKIAPWIGQESADAPGILRNKSYVGFLFQPDGSTNLPHDRPWCLTLKNPRSPATSAAPAANFVTLVIDSQTGRTLAVQP